MADVDIVTWLRSILHNDRSVELHCQKAANEIERLRKERDEASQRVCSIAYPEQHIQELVKTINTLREELRECESLLDEYRRVEMDRDRWDSLREDTNE